MDEKALISKILDDANAVAEKLLNDANAEAEGITSGANVWINEYLENQNKKHRQGFDDALSRQKIAANIEKQKLITVQKQKLILQVKQEVLKQLLSADKKELLKLFEMLLINNAEVGDAVILAENSTIKANDLKTLKVVSSKKLKISTETANINGGFVLCNENCDKNLSLETLVDGFVLNKQSNIAKILFD